MLMNYALVWLSLALDVTVTRSSLDCEELLTTGKDVM